MSTYTASVRAIANLPKLSDFIPEPPITWFPEDFSCLFARTEAHLLQNTLLKIGGVKVGGVVAFRHNDLRELAANPALGMPAEYPYAPRFFRNLIFTTNPPIHGSMRQVLSRPLGPINIQRFEQVAKRVVAELINEVVERGEIDFCSEFNERFTARFWGEIFEMTADEVEQLIEVLPGMAALAFLDPTAEEVAAITVSVDRYLDLVAIAIGRALKKGGNELLESMATAFNAIEDETKPDRLEEMLAANLFDGMHTVAVAGANALYQLLVSPDHLPAVHSDRSLVSNVLTEGLRLSPPVIFSHRCALRDLEFQGTWIPRGTMIMLLLAAGNRDPQVFEHPDRYDLWRGKQGDVTFGGGVHICPGRHIAGMLTRAMLEAVLAPDIQIALSGDPPTWIARSSMRQIKRLQVTIGRI